jgi:NAD dependent epimerase/dehydratase family enzyme
MRQIAAMRLHSTRALLAAITELPYEKRPLWLSVSGCDDLQPDALRRVHSTSTLRARSNGFGIIGIPVRHAIEASRVDASYLYLGLVYGPGKAFAEKILPAIAQGKFPIIGNGEARVPLVHVQDAAQAIIHVAGLNHSRINQQQFVIADGSQTTLKMLIQEVVELTSAPKPKRVPRWLAALVSGSVPVNELMSDIYADPAAILASGFRFRYASLHQGLYATLAELRLLPNLSTDPQHV